MTTANKSYTMTVFSKEGFTFVRPTPDTREGWLNAARFSMTGARAVATYNVNAPNRAAAARSAKRLFKRGVAEITSNILSPNLAFLKNLSEANNSIPEGFEHIVVNSPPSNASVGFGEKSSKPAPNSLIGATQTNIMNFLSKKYVWETKFTTQEIVDALGITNESARKSLKRLSDAGAIEKVGTGTWKFVPSDV